MDPRSRLLPLLLLVGVLSCAGPRLIDDNLQERYANAVRDAATAEPSEISKRLSPVTEANERLLWKGAPDARRLLVSTWTRFLPDVEPGQPDTLGYETWVTLAPEVRTFCRKLRLQGDRLALRLKQLIGLPPDVEKTHFVEYWIDPADLYRPCPDPEITDYECSLDFPQAARFLTISPDYVQWFDTLRSTSYGPDGYPWTRLGYTYDWGNPKDPVGPSEYILPPGTPVELHLVAPTEAYCQ